MRNLANKKHNKGKPYQKCLTRRKESTSKCSQGIKKNHIKKSVRKIIIRFSRVASTPQEITLTCDFLPT